MTSNKDLERMKPLAYVCEGGVVHPAHAMGYTTFRQIYGACPNYCRYAVAELIDGKIGLIDLQETVLSADSLTLTRGPTQLFPTYEAAVMAGLIKHT